MKLQLRSPPTPRIMSFSQDLGRSVSPKLETLSLCQVPQLGALLTFFGGGFPYPYSSLSTGGPSLASFRYYLDKARGSYEEERAIWWFDRAFLPGRAIRVWKMDQLRGRKKKDARAAWYTPNTAKRWDSVS